MLIFALMRVRRLILLPVLLAALACSCTKDYYDTGRKYSRVAVFFTADHNNLAYEIDRNISALISGPLPFTGSNKALLIFRNPPKSYSDFSPDTTPLLIRASSDIYGRPVLDTLLRLDAGTPAADPGTVRRVLEYIQSAFPSDHYGMLMSSHASGWLPKFFYNNPVKPSSSSIAPSSFGVESLPENSDYAEMDITELAAAIPMRLDYLIFDACLMAGVEVAYELKDKVDMLAFSSAEIMAPGMDYTNFTKYLLADAPYSLEAFCRDYYDKYDAMNGAGRTATVSLVDCRKLDALASVCEELFETYRESIASLRKSGVQGFFTRDKHWFFDLEDIVYKAGADSGEMARLGKALDGCVVYKAATDLILGQVRVDSHCGLSMYLPGEGSAVLDEFYRSLAWNRASGLVK